MVRRYNIDDLGDVVALVGHDCFEVVSGFGQDDPQMASTAARRGRAMLAIVREGRISCADEISLFRSAREMLAMSKAFASAGEAKAAKDVRAFAAGLDAFLSACSHAELEEEDA